MGWTRLILPPAVLRCTPRPGRPRRIRRIPNSALRERRGAHHILWEQVGSPSPDRSLCRRRSLRRRPSQRRRPSREISPWGDHAAGPDPGLGASYDDGSQHVHIFRMQRGEVGEDYLLGRAVGIPYYADGRVGWTVLEQDLFHLSEPPVAALRARVVERDHEVRLGRGPYPSLDRLPRRQQIGEADRTMVVPQRGA